MTVRGFLLAMALLVSAPVPAAAGCHRYSVWHYPWPQQCGSRTPLRFRSEAPFVALRKTIVMPDRNDFAPDRNDFDISLPSLARADLDGGDADENSRARLLLRAAVEEAYGH